MGIEQSFWSIGHAAGLFLVLSSVVVFPGLMMFGIRRGHKGGAPPSAVYYAWERRFIMAAAIVAAIGFVLLAAPLQGTAGGILARVGATGYLIAGTFMAAAEALSPSMGYGKIYPIMHISVVLTFLAQAVIGAALLQAGLLAGWIGWATILWNLAWLIVLSLISPRDIYFPVLHYALPLVIGLGLLLS